MLLDESPEGLEWFAGIVDRGAADLRRRETIGLARPSDDVEAVAAILDFIALAPVLLPRHLEHAFGGGADVTVQRWQAATSELLRSGLYPRTSNT
jgi:hypothetical protein